MDQRFSRLSYDPRFLKPKKDQSKLSIDARFASMLSENFDISSAKVDKYGRPQNTSRKQNLSRFYKLDQEEEDEEKPMGYHLARGEGLEESSDEEPVQVEEDPEEVDGFYSDETVPTGDASHRIAIVNLDWDHIKAKDLFKLFDGFKPQGSLIRKVSIYPSEFGKERMSQEQIHGPPSSIFAKNESELKGRLIQEDDGESFDHLKLRKYQLDRLKYYYAILECDTVACAKQIYEQCDGTEFESSANFLDLRYVPDDMEFTDPPHDEAVEAPLAYEPSDFVTASLQHSKVKLTWDEDDIERTKVTRRKFKKEDLKEMDFKAYLASDSDSEDEEAQREKYASLLQNDDEEEPQEDMEITFISGLSEKAASLLSKKKEEEERKNESVFEAQLRKRREKKKERKKALKNQTNSDDLLVGESDEGVDENDPFFQIDYGSDFEKPKEKAQKSGTQKTKAAGKKSLDEDATSRAELELLLMDENESQSRHFDMKSVIKSEKEAHRKKKKKKNIIQGDTQDDFELDVHDPRFQQVLSSHHYAIDPTNPQFKKTKSMKKILEMRREKHYEVPETENKVESLVDSIKRKSQQHQNGIGKRQKK